ncbi:MAG: PAS domain S-box protein [Chitinophagaceae bacterium]|jgi:PAS domain-containing protein|nr:PAS domain S-box protein [Chitinophagaceae bacterium]
MLSINEYPGQLPGSNGSMHLEAITLSATDAIISANSDGNIISWNPAAEKIFGYSAAELNILWIGNP